MSTAYDASSLNTDYGVGADWGSCNISVTDVDNYVKNVRIAVCWKGKGGRLVGEDLNLNGTLDASEDLNANNLIDSACVISSAVARR